MINSIRLKKWSERQQVLAVILIAGAMIFVLWFFLLLPQNRRRHGLEKEIRKKISELERKNYLSGVDELDSRKKDEHEFNRAVHREWEQMVWELGVVPSGAELQKEDVGHIGFKQAHFEVKDGLLKKSAARNIAIPNDLGISEDVSSAEDPRQLMLQLRTIEKLASLLLDLELKEVYSIRAEAPMFHYVEGTDQAFLEECPVRVEFSGPIESFYGLLEAILEPEHVFVLRSFRMEPVEPGAAGLLRINVLACGLYFMKDPDDIVFAPPKKDTGRLSPMGH